MFDVTVTDEFARWFSTLEGRELEEVSSSLDVLAALGPALDPVKASRLLLWFDGAELGRESPLDGLELESPLVADRVQELLAWQREVTRCLNSPEFGERLAALDDAAARAVFEAVERVQQVVRAARELEALRALAELQSGEPLSPRTVRYLAQAGRASEYVARKRSAARPRELLEALKQRFHAVLELVGLDATDVRDPSSGLREMTISTISPRVRILYGIDVPGRRVIVLLGEPLSRAYYGDSVRFAERRFREFLASSARSEASP